MSNLSQTNVNPQISNADKCEPCQIMVTGLQSQNAIAASKLKIALRHHQCAIEHLNFLSLSIHKQR